MKRTVLLIPSIFLSLIVLAQTPESFKYQAVVRDNSGQILTDQSVGLQIDILVGSLSGSSIYSETHSPTTNSFGLITLEVGKGTTSDDFSAIDWGADDYFIQLSLDPSGGTNYQEMGSSQLLSVPYALHAKTAESLTGTGIQILLLTTEEIDTLNASQGEFLFNTTEKNFQLFDGTNWYSMQSDCWPQPSIADAGEDLLYEGASNTVTLGANSPDPGHGSGAWSIIEGSGGSFSDDTDPTAIFTGTAQGTYTLRWTISTPCGSTSDDMTVSLVPSIERLIAGSGPEGKTWVLTQIEASFQGKMGGGGVTNDVAIYPEMSLIPDNVLTMFGLGAEYADEFTFYPDGTLAIDLINDRMLTGIVYGNIMSPNDIIESASYNDLPLASIPGTNISDATWSLSHADKTVIWYDEFVTQGLAQTTFTFPENDPDKIAEIVVSEGAYLGINDLYFPEPVATALGLPGPVDNSIYILKEVTENYMNIAVGINTWPDYATLPSLLFHLILVPK